MILGVGVDIVDIWRLKDVSQGFLERVYTPDELAGLSAADERRTEQLAGMFAAKEAVAKALGCGFGKIGNVSPGEIVILRKDGEAPRVQLSGNAKAMADTIGAVSVYLSISHCKEYAVGYAVAEAEAPRVLLNP
jgi:holo-[acyl-carrier protein] synthase